MYASIAVWTFRTRPSDEIIRQTEREAIDPFSKLPGFVAYYAVRTGELEITTLHVWDTRRHAEEAIRHVAPALQQVIGEHLAGPPARSGGDVVVRRPA